MIRYSRSPGQARLDRLDTTPTVYILLGDPPAVNDDFRQFTRLSGSPGSPVPVLKGFSR
jgi:hypothetical protein